MGISLCYTICGSALTGRWRQRFFSKMDPVMNPIPNAFWNHGLVGCCWVETCSTRFQVWGSTWAFPPGTPSLVKCFAPEAGETSAGRCGCGSSDVCVHLCWNEGSGLLNLTLVLCSDKYWFLIDLCCCLRSRRTSQPRMHPQAGGHLRIQSTAKMFRIDPVNPVWGHYLKQFLAHLILSNPPCGSMFV